MCLHKWTYDLGMRTDMRKKDTRLYADRFPNGCRIARTLFVEQSVYHGIYKIIQRRSGVVLSGMLLSSISCGESTYSRSKKISRWSARRQTAPRPWKWQGSSSPMSSSWISSCLRRAAVKRPPRSLPNIQKHGFCC